MGLSHDGQREVWTMKPPRTLPKGFLWCSVHGTQRMVPKGGGFTTACGLVGNDQFALHVEATP